MILVTGATRNVGGELPRALASAGEGVRPRRRSGQVACPGSSRPRIRSMLPLSSATVVVFCARPIPTRLLTLSARGGQADLHGDHLS